MDLFYVSSTSSKTGDDDARPSVPNRCATGNSSKLWRSWSDWCPWGSDPVRGSWQSGAANPAANRSITPRPPNTPSSRGPQTSLCWSSRSRISFQENTWTGSPTTVARPGHGCPGAPSADWFSSPSSSSSLPTPSTGPSSMASSSPISGLLHQFFNQHHQLNNPPDHLQSHHQFLLPVKA